MERNKNVLNWLMENEEASNGVKIEKIRNELGEGISFSLLQGSNDEGNEVDLQIQIDDYEDELNTEQVTYSIEVDSHIEENFHRMDEAYEAFNERVVH